MNNSNNLVIDTSIFINYALFDKMYRISYAVEAYELHVFVNNHLLSEFEKNLVMASKKRQVDIDLAMKLMHSITICIESEPLFTNSPDPKDNFLFDLAIQTTSEVIVTQEKALLNFRESPVLIHDIKWFKETYPVPL